MLILLAWAATTWLSRDIKVSTALASIAVAFAFTFLSPKVRRPRGANNFARLNDRRFLAASESGNHSFTILDSVRNRNGEIVDFRFAYINAVGARLMFDTPENIVGKLYSERLPQHGTRGTFARYKEVIDTGEAQKAELQVTTPDLDAAWIRVHVCKLDDAVAITATDISELKLTAANLAAKNLLIEENERRLAEIQKLARLGDWDYNFTTDRFQWSSEVRRIFELEPDVQHLTITEVAARVHPDDRERLLGTALQIMGGEEPESVYARILRPAGGVRYLQARAQCHLDDDGKVERVSGTVIDVTEKIELHDALQASNARFANFMEHSPALSFIKDREGRMLYMNASCMEMWDFDPSACTGKFDSDLWGAEIGAQLRVLDRMVIDTDTSDSLIEILPIPGGGVCSLLTHKFPLHIPGGETLIGGVSIDITEQKAAEARALQALADRDILLQEVHHRVKNNLQVICSLLGMQASVTQDPRTVLALRVSQDRVQSMAMIHELLHGRNTGDIDFGEYAGRLMTELFMSYGMPSSRVQPRFNIVSMRLGSDRAILCGLIMNELISNSLKYAFPLQQEGEITVSLAPCGEQSLCMTVEDNGIGMPDGFSLEIVHSLGLRVVQILTKQLDGSFQLQSHGGTRVDITFPIGDLAASPAPATVHPARQ